MSVDQDQAELRERLESIIDQAMREGNWADIDYVNALLPLIAQHVEQRTAEWQERLDATIQTHDATLEAAQQAEAQRDALEQERDYWQEAASTRRQMYADRYKQLKQAEAERDAALAALQRVAVGQGSCLACGGWAGHRVGCYVAAVLTAAPAAEARREAERAVVEAVRRFWRGSRDLSSREWTDVLEACVRVEDLDAERGQGEGADGQG